MAWLPACGFLLRRAVGPWSVAPRLGAPARVGARVVEEPEGLAERQDVCEREIVDGVDERLGVAMARGRVYLSGRRVEVSEDGKMKEKMRLVATYW